MPVQFPLNQSAFLTSGDQCATVGCNSERSKRASARARQTLLFAGRDIPKDDLLSVVHRGEALAVRLERQATNLGIGLELVAQVPSGNVEDR